MAFFALPLFVALGLIVAAVSGNPAALIILPHLLVLGALSVIFGWRKNYRPRLAVASVTADARGIVVGQTTVSRARLDAGFVVPGGSTARVLLRRKLALPLELQTSGTKEARDVLRALGLDVSQAVAHFRTPSRALSRRRYALFAGLGLVGFVLFAAPLWNAIGAPEAIAFAPFILATVFAVLAVLPTSLRVGADGIEIRWLWTRRFVRYGELVEVVRYESGWGNSRQVGLDLILNSGTRVRVPVRQGGWGHDQEQLVLIEERIREAHAGLGRGEVAMDAAMLEQGSLDMAAWVRSLRAIGSGANATMRTAPVPRERLFRILEDPAQGPPARAAAAVALSYDLGDDERERLRVAAGATAAPRLRVAIERAARGVPDAELEDALAEIATERESRGRA